VEALTALLAALFPARCVGCGTPPAAICPACLAGARPAPSGVPPPPAVDWWVAAFSYEGAVREALARLKYRNTRSALALLAAALVGQLEESLPGPIELVTWPPTTPARRRQRGFDQAEHLARAVGRGLDVPVRSSLTRQAGSWQTGRSAQERRRGPAFASDPVAGLSVLVVDDVATTGATLAAAARALRAGGAGTVGAATVGRTLRRGEPSAERCGSVAARSSDPLKAPLSAMTRGFASGRGPPRKERRNWRWNAIP
jgi:predicted amidophosphoribosyltransferase